MTCGELEVLLCDYTDGALGSDGVQVVEAHLETCTECAELVRDARAAMALMERAATVEAPAQLAARILKETSSGRHGRLVNARGWRGRLRNLLAPALQPRLAMGMAVSIVSFSMMARCAGVSPRELRASDLEPVKIWASLDDRAHRLWGRSVKFYEDIKFVYEIQSRLREWSEQQEEEDRARRPLEDRRVLPADTAEPQKDTESPVR